MKYFVIQRVEDVVGGYIELDGDIFSTSIFDGALDALRLDMRRHKDHASARYIFHTKDSNNPFNTSATMGWKCSKCKPGNDLKM